MDTKFLCIFYNHQPIIFSIMTKPFFIFFDFFNSNFAPFPHETHTSFFCTHPGQTPLPRPAFPLRLFLPSKTKNRRTGHLSSCFCYRLKR